MIGLSIFFVLFGHLDPAYAYPVRVGFERPDHRPKYKQQIDYIVESKCTAKGMIPYTGDVYYTCPDGDSFWSDALAPIPNVDPSLYIKNRLKQRNDDSDDTASTVPAYTYYD